MSSLYDFRLFFACCFNFMRELFEQGDHKCLAIIPVSISTVRMTLPRSPEHLDLVSEGFL